MEIKPVAERHRLRDGTSLSIQVGWGRYCTPRNDEGPYTAVEVGYIEDAQGNGITPPETWREYAEDKDMFPCPIYCYVPIERVQEFCDEHGGILVHV